MTLSARIRTAIDDKPGSSHEEIAAAVSAALLDDDDLAAILFELVLERVKGVRRAEVRSIEHQLGRPLLARHKNKAPMAKLVDASERPRLLSQYFDVGDGSSVTWGSATPDQHRLRIGMLTKTRDGITASINLHRDALALIESAGVACLNDLPDTELVELAA